MGNLSSAINEQKTEIGTGVATLCTMERPSEGAMMLAPR
jgi:hypothetical protein